MIISMDLLKEALNASWCSETAYRTDRPFWSEQNKTRGQCTVTAMIVNDFFGGELERGFSKKYNIYHYWNIVFKTKEDLMRIRNVKSRYHLLKQKADNYLSTNKPQ
jgi:hypothetical protein